MSQSAIVVIPEEAELLIPIVRTASSPAIVNLLTYAAPLTRKMLHFNDMKFYTIPPLSDGTWTAPTWLTVELGLLAGRLYFDFSEYEALCKLFNVEELPLEADPRADSTRTENSTDSQAAKIVQERSRVLGSKPLTFLQDWLATTRKGQDFLHTPMGFVCQGNQLKADHPFFASLIRPIAKGESSSSGSVINPTVEAKEQISELDGSDVEQ